MKKIMFIAVCVGLIGFWNAVFAHPGRTAADGCHYCRTNCDYWGVAWNVRHCHGGGVVAKPAEPVQPAEPVYVAPTVEEPVVEEPTVVTPEVSEPDVVEPDVSVDLGVGESSGAVVEESVEVGGEGEVFLDLITGAVEEAGDVESDGDVEKEGDVVVGEESEEEEVAEKEVEIGAVDVTSGGGDAGDGEGGLGGVVLVGGGAYLYSRYRKRKARK